MPYDKGSIPEARRRRVSIQALRQTANLNKTTKTEFMPVDTWLVIKSENKNWIPNPEEKMPHSWLFTEF